MQAMVSFSKIVEITKYHPEIVVSAVKILQDQKKVIVKDQNVLLVSNQTLGCSFCNRARQIFKKLI